MLDRIFKRRESILDEPIDKILIEMKTYSPDTKEYQAAIEHLDRLMKLKAEERKFKISWDTVAIVAGGLLQVLVIVAYEQKHVMTSKGLGFVIKAKS